MKLCTRALMVFLGTVVTVNLTMGQKAPKSPKGGNNGQEIGKIRSEIAA